MDRERTVESDSSRRAVPDKIMNSRAPLHCFQRDIAQRVHDKMQREIAEHEEASREAEPPNRHLIAQNVGIQHCSPQKRSWLQSYGSLFRTAAEVRFGSLAAAARSKWGVRFTPESCRGCRRPACLLWAMSDHLVV
jgi:hypothetical protein